MIKLPSLRSIEKVVKMVPIVKELLPNSKGYLEAGEAVAGFNSLINESEYKIKKLEDALHDKKAEIYTLREKVADLEKIYKSLKRHTWKLEETVTDLEKHVWDLEGNVDNCKYQINILENALKEEI